MTYIKIETATGGPRITPELARQMMNTDGFITVIVTVHANEFMQAHTCSRSDGAASEFDLLHETAFSFGIAINCAYEILGVRDGGLLVEYTAYVADFLAELDTTDAGEHQVAPEEVHEGPAVATVEIRQGGTVAHNPLTDPWKALDLVGEALRHHRAGSLELLSVTVARHEDNEP